MKHFFVSAVAALSLLLVGCNNDPKPSPVPAFHEGDTVTMKMDDRKGTVIRVYDCNDCLKPYISYDVRFSNQSTSTDTHLLSQDGDLQSSPYATVTVNEYELVPRQPGK